MQPLPSSLAVSRSPGSRESFTFALCISYWLSGVVLTQAARYFSARSSGDPLSLRLLIAVVVALVFVKSGLETAAFLTSDAGDARPPAWLPSSSLIVTALATLGVQSFYSIRCYRLVARSLLSAVLLGLFLAIITISLLLTVLGVTVFRRGRMLDPMFLSAYSITTVILDLILTLFLLVVLGRHRRLARESRSAITRMLFLTVECLVPPSVAQILTVSIYLSFQERFYHVPFAEAQAGLYAISILVTLNSRKDLREEVERKNQEAIISTILPRGVVRRDESLHPFVPGQSWPPPEPVHLEEYDSIFERRKVRSPGDTESARSCPRPDEQHW